MYFENLVALHIAIEKNVPVEVAFVLLDRIIQNKSMKIRYTWSNEDREDMLKLKEQGLTWKEIGEIYGIAKRESVLRMARRKLEVK